MDLLVKDSLANFYFSFSNHLQNEKSSKLSFVIFLKIRKSSNIHTHNITTFTVFKKCLSINYGEKDVLLNVTASTRGLVSIVMKYTT
jgi:hypothetical protein